MGDEKLKFDKENLVATRGENFWVDFTIHTANDSIHVLGDLT